MAIIGASGAVSGLFGAVVRLRMRRQLMVIASFLAINLVFAVTGLSFGGGVSGIAWEAHIGGFMAGWLLLPMLTSRPRLRPM